MTDNMTPVDWAKRPLQKYADFSGRAPRPEYWWYTLAVIVLGIIVSTIESTLGLPRLYLTYGPLSLLLMLALIAPGLAVTVRRLHDTGRSGWWILVALVPYAAMMVAAGGAVASGSMGALAGAGLLTIVALCGAIALLIFMILPGTARDNRYGPSPYGIAAPAE